MCPTTGLQFSYRCRAQSRACAFRSKQSIHLIRVRCALQSKQLLFFKHQAIVIMSIEFRCSQCEKLLRVPDESAGKQAKCPECGALSSVPASMDENSAGPATQPTSTGSSWPYGEDAHVRPVVKSESSTVESVNPYAAPAAGYALDYGASPKMKPGEMQYTRVDLSELFGRTWAVFSSQMGNCVLFGLIVIGIYIGVAIVTSPLQFAQEMLNQEGEVIAGAGVNFVGQLIDFLVQAAFACISILFGLNLLRRSPSPLNGIFNIGRCYLPVLLQQFLLGLINFGIILVIAGPVVGIGVAVSVAVEEPSIGIVLGIIAAAIAVIVIIVVTMMFFLAPYLIVDRGMGVIEAMKTSKEFMTGNKGTVFVVQLIAGLLGGLFSLVTCCIGTIFVIPYMAVLGTVVYLAATGQFSVQQPVSGLERFYH